MEQNKDRSTFRQYMVALTVNMGTICFGSVMGWVSPSLPILVSEDTPIDKPLTDDDVSWVGSLLFISALLGTIIFVYLNNTLGRKWSATLVAVPFMISWIFIIVAKSVVYIFIARIFGGVGAGGVLATTPLYVAETAEDKVRGRLGSFLSMTVNTGCVLSYSIGSFMPYEQVPYVLFTIAFVTFIVTVLFLPETPVFLMKKGEEEKANNTLRWLRGVKKDCESKDEELQEEMLKLKSFSQTETPQVTYKDFMNWVTLRGMATGFALVGIQQLTAVFALFSYASTIFEQSGSSVPPNRAAIMVGSLQVIGAFVSSTFIEKAGRRVLLIGSALTVSTCQITLGTFIYFNHIGYDTSSLGWVPVAALSICVFGYSCGLGPVPLIVCSELFARKIRGVATSICVFIFWVFAFIIVKFFNSLSASLGIHGCFWLLGGCMLLGALFTFLCLPETKSRSLEDILTDLGGKKKVVSVIV